MKKGETKNGVNLERRGKDLLKVARSKKALPKSGGQIFCEKGGGRGRKVVRLR